MAYLDINSVLPCNGDDQDATIDVVYLDIDGVLICRGDDDDAPIVQQRANLIKTLCLTTGASIVVSSQRRISDDVFILLHHLGLTCFINRAVPYRTPFVDDLDPDLSVRGQEIDAHLKANSIGAHVVIDDDFALGHHNQVMIDSAVGVTQGDIDKAITFLRK